MKHSDKLRAPEILFEDDRQQTADALDAAEQWIGKQGHINTCLVWKIGDIDDGGPYNECTCGHDAVLKQIRGEG
jgi:hypothetical protein